MKYRHNKTNKEEIEFGVDLMADLEGAIIALEQEVAALKAEVAALQAEMTALKKAK